MPSRVLANDQVPLLYVRYRSGAASLEQLAAEAGVHPMTLHGHFTGQGLSPKWRAPSPSRSFRRRTR
jgi:hypothetical protein